MSIGDARNAAISVVQRLGSAGQLTPASAAPAGEWMLAMDGAGCMHTRSTPAQRSMRLHRMMVLMCMHLCVCSLCSASGTTLTYNTTIHGWRCCSTVMDVTVCLQPPNYNPLWGNPCPAQAVRQSGGGGLVSRTLLVRGSKL